MELAASGGAKHVNINSNELLAKTKKSNLRPRHGWNRLPVSAK
jgi:hypothetical protein